MLPITCLAMCSALVFTACDAFQYFGSAGVSLQGPVGATTELSEGRKNASRLINTAPGSFLRFQLRQQNLADATQTRCDPLGNNVGTPWPVIVQRVFTPAFFNEPSEYDYIALINETGYALALRVPVEPTFPLQYSQIEFSLRAVNPCANGHLAVPGAGYGLTQADFPSNDDNASNRSLIDLSGGDVALLIAGVNFEGAPKSTAAFMNFLGPTGWLVFMRDNALQSGRFYNISGALKGGPPAFFDTPSPDDDGPYESVQVNGENFDALSEPLVNMIGVPDVFPCDGAPTPGRHYAFVDLSNHDEDLLPSAGEGGGLFIIRREAFEDIGVVMDPDVPGPLPAPVVAEDVMPAPLSGYNESDVPNIDCSDKSDNSFNGPAGVHEIGWSIFFIHGDEGVSRINR